MRTYGLFLALLEKHFPITSHPHISFLTQTAPPHPSLRDTFSPKRWRRAIGPVPVCFISIGFYLARVSPSLIASKMARRMGMAPIPKWVPSTTESSAHTAAPVFNRSTCVRIPRTGVTMS